MTSADSYTHPPKSGNNAISVVAAAAAIIALLTGVGYLIYRYRPAAKDSPRSIKLDKVTTDGKTFAAAISPDGRYAVYNVDSGGAQSLWTRQIATASPVQIIPPADGVEYSGIRFTPDGNFVTFRKRDISTTLFTLYQMPVLGGAQKKLAADVDGTVTFSPDGKLLAWGCGDELYLSDAATGELKLKMGSVHAHWPTNGSMAFSPDGSLLASGGDDSTILVHETATGKEVAKLTGHKGAITSLGFSADGQRLASGSADTTILIWDAKAWKK
jgi:WD40 repeat protein